MMNPNEDAAVMIAREVREAAERVRAKLGAMQLGLAFIADDCGNVTEHGALVVASAAAGFAFMRFQDFAGPLRAVLSALN